MIATPSPPRFLTAAVFAGLLASGPASAVTLFSQTITNPAVFDGASASDRDSLSTGLQIADDVTLATSATVRSVTWWGVFGPFNNTPVTPVSFDLIFYGDSGGLPDTTSILSSSAVQFASLTNTGDLLNGDDIYVFTPDISPTVLDGGTNYWFSVLANTDNDLDDSFLWRVDAGDNSASRVGLTGPFSTSINQVPLFILEGDLVPEPSALALLGLGALRMARRRRRA